MTRAGASPDTADPVRDRSIRLFKFLYEVEQYRSSRVHNLSAYGAGTPPGAVLWLADVPDEAEVRTVLHGTLSHEDDAVLEVDRRELPPAPPLPAELAGRVDEPGSTDLENPPRLKADPETGEVDDESGQAYDRWLVAWRPWAQEVNRLRPVRQLYRRLFRIYEQLDQHPEELEAALAAGCLSWQPPEHAGVQRHVAVMSSHLMFDAESGLITLRLLPTRECQLELDMLDPKKHPRHSLVEDVQTQLADVTTSVLDPEELTGPLKTITHGLSDEAVYDGDALRPQTISPRAHVAFAPAFIVRKRTNERKLRVLRDIIAALEDQEQELPDGVASIVEAVDLDAGEPQIDFGTDLDSAESYLPLEANRAQQEIVWSVEHRRHTVVQGPPGTGKTHTIANILSHLLATGRRVLITAHTERALKEVRGKLPASLQDLAIAVTGQGRDEKAALERSVREMTAYVDSYEPVRAQKAIDELEAGLDQLRREQARIRTELVQARVDDVETTEIGVYSGTPAQIAQRLADLAHRYEWLTDPFPPAEPPLDREQRRRLLELLRRSDFEPRSDEIDQPLPNLDALPSSEEFIELVSAADKAEQRASAAQHYQQHAVHPIFSSLDDSRRRQLETELRAVADDVRVLQARPEPWIMELLRDLAAGKPGVWEQRADDLDKCLERASKLLAEVGSSVVRIPADLDLDRLLAPAEGLRDHLLEGGSVRRVFNAKAVRDASELLDRVLVDGVAPDTLSRVKTFIAQVQLIRELDRADRCWPDGMEVPQEDTFSERLAWHRSEHEVLVQALTTGKRLTDLHRDLTQLRAPHPDWNSPEDIARFADVAGEPDLQRAMCDRRQPLADLAATLSAGRTGPVRHQLREAVERRDEVDYQRTYALVEELRALRDERAERDELAATLSDELPTLAEELGHDAGNAIWDDRLDDLSAACAWSWARKELQHRLDSDRSDELMQELDAATTRLRRQVLTLTVERAWAHAVDRLDPLQRRRLNTYALLAKRLPKGGKYRARKLRELQDALRLCRDAVPAWIMPINYVADVLDVDPEAFDVVIVDEASQAGMDANFLQYLAPKMIVIGDDLQVSPTSFLDRSELHRLADDLLYDFEDKGLWEDPGASLFDHASNRFGKRITLVEHFRCMPEIIGFSQRFVYEPNGVNLIPLRQYGAERLTPVRTCHVPDGYRTGKVNPPEVDAVVELVAKCAADPAYEVRNAAGELRKRTFGVISLTGSDQAKQIDHALVERLGEQEYAERDIRCGDAADFQGSQREVIFLSLVDAPDEDRGRLYKRGDSGTEQRINVAASRAQDQMWLVHSVLPAHMHPEDIRHKLLTYSLMTERQFGTQQHAVPEPEDENVLDADRFDSLFEQHVFNRIVDRGYAVQPQVPVSGYRIDLVVIGSEARIAVECDGDEFHGADQYAADIARQRDLERAGWTFFRIRGSAFYADRQEALQPLWELLESHGIQPITETLSTTGGEDFGTTAGAAELIRLRPTDSRNADGESTAPPVGRAAGPPPPPLSDRSDLATSAAGAWDDESVTPDIPSGEERQCFAHGGAESRPLWEDRAQLRLDEHDSPGTRGTRTDVEQSTGAAQSEQASRQSATRREEARQGVETNDVKDHPLADLAAVYDAPKPYERWDISTRLPDPHEGKPSEREEGLRRIIEVEGPILGERLYQLYAKSAGKSQAGSAIRSKLNSATWKMEQKGILDSEDPLGQGGQMAKTFRLASQPPFIVRERGDRSIHEVPPLELAARIRALRRSGDSEEDTFRRVLADYDLIRLTTPTRERLKACSDLLDGLD